MLFWKMKCDTVVRYGNRRGLTVKPGFPCRQSRDMSRTRLGPHIPFLLTGGRVLWAASALSRQVCSISAEQQRQPPHPRSVGRSLIPSGPTSPLRLLLFSSESSGFLFSRSGAYHLFLHRCPPPFSRSSSQGMKGYFGGIDLVGPADPRGLRLSLSESGGSVQDPLFLSPWVGLLRDPDLLSSSLCISADVK